MFKNTLYGRFIKRSIDFIASLLLIVVFSPLYILVALLVRLNLGSPIVFKQDRPGLNGEIFTLYKFRTMKDSTDKSGKLLSDADRLTRFGKMLRASSLDELPEFWNILKGEMSFIGPRPLLIEYLPLYSKEQSKRHNVRPGLSGWAQVNGRNAISWEKKFELDVEYVESVSFAMDFKILLMTVAKVIIREGITSESTVTMEKFKGSR